MRKLSTVAALAAIAAAGAAAAQHNPLAPYDGVRMKGVIGWRLIDADGVPVSEEVARQHGAEKASGVVDNLVTTVGKTLMAQLWSGQGGGGINAPTHIAIGSGATAEAVGQTALTTETARVALDTCTNTANVATVIGTIPAGTGTGTVNEVGLFTANVGGTMTQRALTGAITKPAGLGLQFTWTTTFN